MCGIYLHAAVVNDGDEEPEPVAVPDWLRRRGPDHAGSVVVTLPHPRKAASAASPSDKAGPAATGEVNRDDGNVGTEVIKLTFQASVLQMRSSLVPQPVAVDGGESPASHLAWNGEVYQRTSAEGASSAGDCGGDSVQHAQETWSYSQSDTEVVAELLRRASAGDGAGRGGAEGPESRVGSENHLLPRLAGALGTLVNAEYAFCLVRPPLVYYGRDVWGRRSLLVRHANVDGDGDSAQLFFQLSSVVTTQNIQGWKEVPPGRVYCYDLETRNLIDRSLDLDSGNGVWTRGLQDFDPAGSHGMEAASMQLEALLLESVRRRVDGPSLTGVSVLFSGGVDSAVLAALALRVLDDATPLYLVNVEFVDDREDEALRTTQAADTLSAQSSYAELMRIFPTHSVHFVRERIAWTDIQERQTHIHSLVSPKSSVMDLNIGAALWFASRAAPTRVILTGLGADEQLGGYGRHRKAWESGGGGFHAAHSLRQELQRDQDRLWDRNLGRDDRVMSDHGKEARYPYLDDCVVAYLRSLPPDLICDYSLPPGQGDKRILRLLAERLGCTCASATVKRAIQFGSRMAHVCDKQRFGSRRKATGEATLVVLS